MNKKIDVCAIVFQYIVDGELIKAISLKGDDLINKIINNWPILKLNSNHKINFNYIAAYNFFLLV